MKKIGFVTCVVTALMLLSCEKTPVEVPDNNLVNSLPETIVWDLNGRYPDATITSVSGGADTEYVNISLTDKDGLKNKAVYRNGEWVVSEKRLEVNGFLNALPKPVVKAYLKTGISHETFLESSYVIEIARKGFNQKQYEIDCTAPYLDGDELIEGLHYHIVIAEDGTLLVCGHRESFNSTIGMVDLSPAIAFIREKYGYVPIVGMIDDGGYANVFIRDGSILKNVKLRAYRSGFEVADFEWRDTEYALPMDMTLPARVQKAIEEHETRFPGEKWTGLSMLETMEGFSYGLTFGPELHRTTFYVKAEV